MKLNRLFSGFALALAIVPATLCAAPLAQFAYRDVNLHFVGADGKVVMRTAGEMTMPDLEAMLSRLTAR